MRIGTLSFEIRGEQMALSGAERVARIASVVAEYSPDLLLCAGYSLETNSDLDALSKHRSIRNSNTAIVVEVKKDADLIMNGHPAFDYVEKTIKSTHRMFALTPGKKPQSLGAQFIRTSAELNRAKGNTNAAKLIELIEANIEGRAFEVGGKRVTALCCGEINILRGRDNIEVRSGKIMRAIFDSDIIVNPTHDGMANYGTLNAKRRFLSQPFDNRGRCYVSSSNWNTEKERSNGKTIRQKPGGETMQSVFVSRTATKMERHSNPQQGYEYRQVEVDF